MAADYLPPGGRPIPIGLVCLVNTLMTLPMLIALLFGAKLPPEIPGWYKVFGITNMVVMLVSVVGLWRLRRWGFGLMSLSYAAAVVALAKAHAPLCPIVVITPCFFMAASQWRVLR